MTDGKPTRAEAKAQRRRKALLRDVKGWALSREGMNEPASRARLEAMADKADESIRRIDGPEPEIKLEKP